MASPLAGPHDKEAAVYRELLIFPKALEGKPMRADEARTLIGTAIGSEAVPPLLFGRDESGALLQPVIPGKNRHEENSAPAVTFGGGKGLLRVIGIGREGADAVTAATGVIMMAVSRYLKTACSFKVNEGRHTARCSMPSTYLIRDLCVSKKADIINQYRDFDGHFSLAGITPLIRRALINGLVSSARKADGGCLSPLEAEIPSDSALGIRVLSGRPYFAPIVPQGRSSALFVGMLTFALNMDLGGPWTAGHLRSRGYGLIIKPRPVALLRKEAA